jgi:hypothetical protein
MCSQGVQGVLEVVALRVASVRLWRAMRDASGRLARSGRAVSGVARASTSTRPWLGEVGEHGGVVWHQGQ